jgi:hypothetical protein
MSSKIRLNTASATQLVLAKIGNPQRDESLQTSRSVYTVAEEDQELLTALFLKPFKNLSAYRFTHYAALEQNEMHGCARRVFGDPASLLETGVEIARRLYAKSTHPNIKSGDLCIALLEEVHVDGELVRGLCILKSDSVVPFLSITTQDGDLRLRTEQGIQPEKIDKGCLILDVDAAKGYHVLMFDRAGGDTKFWMREFLGVEPVPDASFLTSAYAKMAVSFLEEAEEKPAADDGPPPWENCAAAREALEYFEERDRFDLEEFEREVLLTPEAREKFQETRARIEAEQGVPLEPAFEIAKKEVNKAKRRIGAVLKLDTGVEIHVKPTLATEHDPVLERGFDAKKKMKFVKVYYNEQLAAR